MEGRKWEENFTSCSEERRGKGQKRLKAGGENLTRKGLEAKKRCWKGELPMVGRVQNDI